MSVRHVTSAQHSLMNKLGKLFPRADFGYGRDKTGPYVIVKGVEERDQIIITSTGYMSTEVVRVVYR